MSGLQKTLIKLLRTYYPNIKDDTDPFLYQEKYYSLYIKRSGLNWSIYKYNIDYNRYFGKNIMSRKSWTNKNLKETIEIINSIMKERENKWQEQMNY